MGRINMSTIVCLGGGLLAFGTSLYSSYSSSDHDPPWKKNLPPDHHAARGGKKDNGSGHGDGGGGTGMRNISGLTKERGGDPNARGVHATASAVALPTTDNTCTISSGTGCSFFVSTAEWVTMTGALVATPVHPCDADADGGDGDHGDDDDVDGDSGGHGESSARVHAGDGNDGDASGDRGGVNDEAGIGDGGDSTRGGSSVLPEADEVMTAHVWPWLPGDLPQKEETNRAQLGTLTARYNKPPYYGQESVPVPNPVCLTVYMVVMLVAVYRGNPRRGVKRARRLQRRGRSPRYAKRRVAILKKRHDGVAVATIPFFVPTFPLVRMTNLTTDNNGLPDVDLFSESRLEINDQSVTCVSPVGRTIPSENTSQETEPLGNRDNVGMDKPNLESAVVHDAAAAKKKTIADINVGLLGSCDEGKKKAKPTATGEKLTSTVSKTNLECSVVRIATFANKVAADVEVGMPGTCKQGSDAQKITTEPDTPNQEGLFGGILAKPPIGTVLDCSSCEGKKPNVDTAVVPAAPSAKSKNISGVIGPSGISTEVINTMNPQTASKTAAASPTPPSSVPVRTTEKPFHVARLSDATLDKSTACTVLDSSSSAGNKPTVNTVVIPAAAFANTRKTIDKPDLSSKGIGAIPTKKRQTATTGTATTTAACAAKDLKVDTAVIPAAGSTNTKKNAGNVEPFGKSTEAIMGKKRHTTTTATPATAVTPTLPDPAGVPSKSSFHDVPSKDDQALQSPRPTPEPRPLSNVDELFESKKPAIKGVSGWFSGISINIDQDGNCFGTAWMVAALVWAAQSPARLQLLISELENAGRPGQAFGCLDLTCKGYVEGFVVYVKELKNEWIGHAPHDSTCATNLAVGVIKTFLGTNCQGYVCDQKEGGDPTWRKLKWGAAIAARALDAWAAATHDSEMDTEMLRKLREPVVLDFEKLQANLTSSPDEGEKDGVLPPADVLRPGGSMGLLTGLVVDTYARGQRITDDYTDLFEGATNTPSNRTTTGIAVLQAGLPHFDILVTPSADILFYTTLAAIFDLQEPAENDPKALSTLKHNVESQLKTTPEQLGEFIRNQEQRDAQIAAMQAFQDMQTARQLDEQKARQLQQEINACDSDEEKACDAEASTAPRAEQGKARDVGPKQQQPQQGGNNRNCKKRGKRTRHRKRR